MCLINLVLAMRTPEGPAPAGRLLLYLSILISLHSRKDTDHKCHKSQSN